MKCPQCGAELPEGAAVCPRCGAAVVEQPRPGAARAADDDEPDFVTVLETADPAELAVAQSLLDAEGIDCRADGYGTDDVIGLDQLTGLIRLQVAPQDAEAARALLEARDTVDPTADSA